MGDFIDGGAVHRERQRSRRGWDSAAADGILTCSPKDFKWIIKVCVGHGFEAPVELLSGDGWQAEERK